MKSQNTAPGSKGGAGLVRQVVVSIASTWIGKLLLAGPAVIGMVFAHLAWQSIAPNLNESFRWLIATERATATQSELYWEVIPGRDFRATPDDPDRPREPRLTMRLTLDYPGPGGIERLHLAGPDTGAWAEASMFFYPLLHLGDLAQFSGPVELRIDPDYLTQLKAAPSSYLPAAEGSNEIEAIMEQLDRPLENLALIWWLTEAGHVMVDYSPYLSNYSVVEPLGKFTDLLKGLFGTFFFLIPAYVFLMTAVMWMFLDASNKRKVQIVGLVLLTAPVWSPQLDTVLPWLGDNVGENGAKALSFLEGEPRPDNLRIADPMEGEFVALQFDPTDSRDAAYLKFFDLDRAGRQFGHIEDAYSAILDDITRRITSATNQEFRALIRMMRPYRNVYRPPFDDALLEGMNLVALDESRPDDVRETAQGVVGSIVNDVSYGGYYRLAPKTRVKRLQAHLEHADPAVREHLAERIHWILEHTATKDAGY